MSCAHKELVKATGRPSVFGSGGFPKNLRVTVVNDTADSDERKSDNVSVKVMLPSGTSSDACSTASETSSRGQRSKLGPMNHPPGAPVLQTNAPPGVSVPPGASVLKKNASPEITVPPGAYVPKKKTPPGVYDVYVPPGASVLKKNAPLGASVIQKNAPARASVLQKNAPGGAPVIQKNAPPGTSLQKSAVLGGSVQQNNALPASVLQKNAAQGTSQSQKTSSGVEGRETKEKPMDPTAEYIQRVNKIHEKRGAAGGPSQLHPPRVPDGSRPSRGYAQSVSMGGARRGGGSGGYCRGGGGGYRDYQNQRGDHSQRGYRKAASVYGGSRPNSVGFSSGSGSSFSRHRPDMVQEMGNMRINNGRQDRDGGRMWKELGFSDPAIGAIMEEGVGRPREIYKTVCPLLLHLSDLRLLSGGNQRDDILAVMLPFLDMISLNPNYQMPFRPSCLVLCGNEQRVEQINRSVYHIAKNLKVGVACVRGSICSIEPKDTHVVIGTSLDIVKMLSRKLLCLLSVHFLLIDQPDEMSDPVKSGVFEVTGHYHMMNPNKDRRVTAMLCSKETPKTTLMRGDLLRNRFKLIDGSALDQAQGAGAHGTQPTDRKSLPEAAKTRRGPRSQATVPNLMDDSLEERDVIEMHLPNGERCLIEFNGDVLDEPLEEEVPSAIPMCLPGGETCLVNEQGDVIELQTTSVPMGTGARASPGSGRMTTVVEEGDLIQF